MTDPLTLGLGILLTVIIAACLGFALLRPHFSEASNIRNRRVAYAKLAQRKRITVACTQKELDWAWNDFASEMRGVVGIDCEWTTTEENAGPICLLQMALPTGACLLIRISCLEEPPRSVFPPSLLQMLSDPKVLKFGVGVTFDADKFLKDHGVLVRGCVDLRHLVVRVRNNGLERRGLKNIARVWLGIVYESGKDIQCSVWDQKELSPEQVEYAAMDGLVAVYTVAEFLYRKKKLQNPKTAEEIQTDLDNLSVSSIRSMCQGVIDCRFKFRHFDPIHQKRSTVRDKQKAFRIPERKSPLYTNAVMQAPDGQLLCLLDVKKARWYLDRGLATLLEDGDGSEERGMTIRLNFEPAARESGQDWQYYLQEKVNQCVVCGSSGPLARKHIVPHEYRRSFPEELKFHKSHDVLLLCLPCHRHCNLIDDAFKRQLAAEFAAPTGTRENVAFVKDERAVAVMRAAKALRLSGERIPETRRQQLEDMVLSFFAEEERLSLQECLDRLEKEPPIGRVANPQFVTHGEAVVAAVSASAGGLRSFERRWRQHFVETMAPQYLPAGWSVDHRCRDLA